MKNWTPPGRRARPLRFEPLENRQMLATTVGVHVAGTTGTENFRLLIDGVAVANWTNTRVLTAARTFDAFVYSDSRDLTIDRIRVQFMNDGTAPAGGNRDLFVDGVTLNGIKYESEASSVYSTGTWDPVTNSRLEGYRQSEGLHYNGYFQYGSRGSTIQVRAAGSTGSEQMKLVVNNVVVATYDNVAGSYSAGQFQSFTYNSPMALPLSQIRVDFTNDGTTAGGADRNLRVDGVTLDGVKTEAEAASTYTNAAYIAGQGRGFGHLQTEFMPLGGYLQFGAYGTVVEVRAAGRTGEEQMQLQISGAPVMTVSNVGGNYGTGAFVAYVYASPSAVALNQVRVAYTNDGNTAGGVDKNLRVDSVVLDGVAFQAEAADVYSTGTFVAEIGARAPGLWQTEYLHLNGYFQFASGAVPGTLALGTSLVTVDEFTSTVSIPVVRSGGSDGTIGLRYTTVNASATAGSDYTAKSGLLVFGPGETTKSIVVTILNDSLTEPNETFNLSGDQVIGGGSITQPRTATITIVDDELPTPGTGNGLLGQYYNNADLTGFVFERTDQTVNFNWGNGSPSSSIGGDTFSVRWVGKIEPLYNETYTFRADSDDGVRLWINNQLVIDQWKDLNAEVTGTISLLRGRKYDIRMEYFENAGGAREILRWQSPSQTLQVVPQTQLYSDPPAPSETGTFSGQVVASGLSGPVAMDFDSTGRIFIAEQRGVVRLYQNGALLPTPFLDIQSRVNFIQDRGILGVAVHPDFPNTPYVYVSYTYDPPETAGRSGNAGPDGGGNRVSRISRFTADPAFGFNRAIEGSEVVLVGTNSTWANISHPELDSTDDISIPPSGGQNGELRDILIADSRTHTVGNLAFGPDGKLYAANGDGTSYGRVDPRTSRVQSIDSLSGKILRIDPITGAGLADNPFYNGDAGANRSKVYDYGLRNPFRFAFSPTNSALYIGDVGWNTWEELNTGRGQNFGWPWFEGASGTSQRTGGYQDLQAAKDFYASGQSVTAPLWARAHSAGGVAIVVGDFYTGTVYPTSYRNALFISDFGDPQLRVVRLNADGSLQSVQALGLNVGTVVEMSMGRDGYLYYADIVGGRIGRLNFTPGVLALETSEEVGDQPAVIGDFNGDSEVDGADLLSWQRSYGATGLAYSQLPGDADFNGSVNELDLNLVNWGYHVTASDAEAQLAGVGGETGNPNPAASLFLSPTVGGGQSAGALVADDSTYLALQTTRPQTAPASELLAPPRPAFAPPRKSAETLPDEIYDLLWQSLATGDEDLL